MFLTILFFLATGYFFWAIFQAFKMTPEQIADMEKELKNQEEYEDRAFSRDWIDKEDKNKEVLNKEENLKDMQSNNKADKL